MGFATCGTAGLEGAGFELFGGVDDPGAAAFAVDPSEDPGGERQTCQDQVQR